MFKLISTLIIFCLFTTPAFSYLGPGFGGGVILATFGIIVAIFAAFFGLIWFPIKRLIKKRKEKQEKQEEKVD